ncbi:MAG: porin family protein [Chitinophagales bacterium]
MKKTYCLLLILLPLYVLSQKDTTHNTKTEKRTHNSIGIGIKAGLNFSNVTNASSISNSSETGFQVGLFLDPETHSILGSRTELVYSRQGYDWSSGQTTGKVMLDYLTLAQLMAINITHFVQIQVGAQFSYLLTAKADSSKPSTGVAAADEILSYYNRFDYGFGVGLEVRPILGLLVGVRYNLSFSNLYKQPDYTTGTVPPSFIPSTSDINLKNNLVQIYLGWRF